MKELRTLKDELYRKQKYPNDFQVVEVQYFDPSASLEEETRHILDARIAEVAEKFNDRLA